MNVLFVVHSFPSHDNSNWGAFNYRAVKKMKEEVEFIQVLHLRAWRPGRKIWNEYTIDGIQVWSFAFLYSDSLPKRLKGLIIGFYKFILHQIYIRKKEIKFNIIHSVSVYFSGIVGAYLAKKEDIFHVAQCIGSDVNINLPKIKDFLGVSEFQKNVDIFTCNSLALEKSVKQMYPDVKTKTIYRGVVLEEFSFSPLKIIEKSNLIVFLYIGGLPFSSNKKYGKNLKGGLELLDAWKTLIGSDNRLGSNIKLLFGGPYTSPETITSILECSPSDYNIEVVGQINRNEVKGLMSKSSIIIVPSMAEGLPNVAMEAASIGRPVIGTKVGGIPELIIDGKTGFLFDSGNKEQLMECITKFLRNSDLIIEYGRNARQHIETNFDNKTFITSYLQLYKTLANK
jgi:glycosyltransferase involved in cell wall biosynthesis